MSQSPLAPATYEEIDLNTEWAEFINNQCNPGPLKDYLLHLNEEGKKTYLPWVEHIKTLKATNRESNKDPLLLDITPRTPKLV